jgi:hypothetical protein
MSSEATTDDTVGSDSNGRSSLRAAWVLDRWRKHGFDTLVCSPSGYCSPENSSTRRAELPDGYRIYPIDSDAALDAITTSIEEGTSYRL